MIAPRLWGSLHPVSQQQEGILSPLRRNGKLLVYRGVFHFTGKRRYPLMGFGAAQRAQFWPYVPA